MDGLDAPGPTQKAKKISDNFLLLVCFDIIKTASEMHVATRILKAASRLGCLLELIEYCSVCSG